MKLQPNNRLVSNLERAKSDKMFNQSMILHMQTCTESEFLLLGRTIPLMHILRKPYEKEREIREANKREDNHNINVLFWLVEE